MSLSKVVKIDRIEVTEMSVVQVRQVTQVFEDDTLLSSSYHRWLILPGQDYSQEDARVQAVCAAVHTPEAIAAYAALNS